MFHLTKEEYDSLRCQIGILKRGRHSKYPPLVFTEQGVAMLSGVLHGKRAVRVNVAVMRTFVRLREALALHEEFAGKLAELERRVAGHDGRIRDIFNAIRRLTAFEGPPSEPADPPRKIGSSPEAARGRGMELNRLARRKFET